ncbi:MAG TPA: hypothetical protein VFD01_03905 [Candidatus Dormibacteraeota bacterium]|jgi:multisubunit Na+/H+ antiporter MnhE subunit|nr:hypothetical protein [Candidatus Dormibacteraeota bacterium]
MPRRQPRLGRRRAAGAAAAWFLLFCLWLWLVDGAPPEELWTGAVAAALAAAATVAAADAGRLRFRPAPAWFLDAVGLPPRLITDTWALLGLLAGRVRGGAVGGRYLAVSRPVRAIDARTCARRVLLTLVVGFTPRTLVVDFDREEGLVLVHELAPRGPGPDLPLRRL